ncbi:MAG: hypothetical protein HYS32_00190 [Candidatus Woesearchaeota archaeon]|nr:MAG: hypothetical protein HYS32_00190 [Candidatus Woesearchaeota archaeon]
MRDLGIVQIVDRKEVLEDMRGQVEAFRRVVSPSSKGNKKRVNDSPYLSAFGVFDNKFELDVVDGGLNFRLEHSRGVLAAVHLPLIRPGYGFSRGLRDTDCNEAFEYALNRARGNKALLGGEGAREMDSIRIRLPDYLTRKGAEHFDVKDLLPGYKPLLEVPHETLLAVLQEIYNSLLRNGDIIGASVELEVVESQELFVNSFGAVRSQVLPRIGVFLTASSPADDMPRRRLTMKRGFGVFGGFYELLDPDNKNSFYEEILSAARGLSDKVVQFRDAPKNLRRTVGEGFPKGFKLVLDGAIATTALHEHIGHHAEALRVTREEGDSSLSMHHRHGEVVNKKVDLTVKDINDVYAIKGRKVRPWSFRFFDVQGVDTTTLSLIEGGRYKFCLTDIISPDTLGGRKSPGTNRLTGSVRLKLPWINFEEKLHPWFGIKEEEDDAEKPGLPNPGTSRQSTMFLVPCENGLTLNEMLSRSVGGIYVGSSTSEGVTDTGTTQGVITLPETYAITRGRNGKIKLIPIRRAGGLFVMPHDTEQFLGSITYIGKPEEVSHEAAFCGAESDWIRIGLVGPPVTLENAVIQAPNQRPKWRKSGVRYPRLEKIQLLSK